MREIKFRAWNKRTNQFGRPATLREALKFAHNNPEAIEELDYLNIMQYTGLKDSKGKEIYEGDIIRNSWGTVYCMEWSAVHASYIRHTARGYGGIDIDEYPNGAEVIGNVYEHPKLLEEKP